jgi:type II secretory ATPase GspE/PulE/Tfp pilus assembly ATPase PilB-like protein
MFRKATVFIGSFSLLLLVASTVMAQDWPEYRDDPLLLGPGNYLAWYKMLLIWVLVGPWVATTDWIGRDTLEFGDSIGMPSRVWNPIAVFAFLVGFLLAISIPLFFVGYLILFLGYVGPLITYIIMRNGRVTDDQKVLTREHLKAWLAARRSGRKGKGAQADGGTQEPGPPVKLSACGGSETENQANLIIARQSPGYVTTKELISDALSRRASRIRLDYGKESVGIRYDIDGVWHAIEPGDRETGDVMLAVMKKICNLDMEERRARQEGEFRAKCGGDKLTCHLVSQGTKTGESAIINLLPDELPFETLEELGMREKMRNDLKELLGAESGFLVLSAIPVGGLRTTWNVALRSTDRYLRDFVAIEDQQHAWTNVENVEANTYDGGAGETPDKVLRSVLLREPDAVAIPDLANAETANRLFDYVLEMNRLVITSTRSKDGVEAMLRILALKPEPEKYSQALTGVLNQRLVRKLCETCRQAYEPSDDLLKKLGVPRGRIEVLYRQYQPPPPDDKKRRKAEPEICPDCNGVGYKGRTAIFELLIIDDQVRSALLRDPKPDVLRRLARKAGNRSLQEEAVLLVLTGATSLVEMQRAMKQ